MKTFIVIIFCLILALSICLLIRNDFVCNFKILLSTRGYEVCKNYLMSLDELTPEAMEVHLELVNVWNSIIDIPYERFLFSFKPLEPEYWLTEKQLAFLKINTF